MMDTEKTNNSKFYKWFIVFLIVVLAAVAVYGVKAKNQRLSSRTTDMGLDPNQGEYVEPKKEEKSVATEDEKPDFSKMVAIPGVNTIHASANSTEVTGIDFYNPDHNIDKFYLTYEIRLSDKSEQGYEVLYSSKLIEPTKHIQKITLNRALDAGEYKVTVFVQPYTISDKTKTNSMSFPTKLIVK